MKVKDIAVYSVQIGDADDDAVSVSPYAFYTFEEADLYSRSIVKRYIVKGSSLLVNEKGYYELEDRDGYVTKIFVTMLILTKLTNKILY